MRYKVVCHQADDIDTVVQEIKKQVELLSKTGWKLHGGISVAAHVGGGYYACQAVAK